MFSLQVYVIAAIASFVLYYSLNAIKISSERKKIPGIEKTKPILRYPQQNDKLGFKWMKSQWEAYSNQRFLEAAWKRYEAVGNTFQVSRLGGSFLQTRDPENIKAILATNFQDFGLGARMNQMGPFLGKGIFTTDGKAWEHSRVSSYQRYCVA